MRRLVSTGMVVAALGLMAGCAELRTPPPRAAAGVLPASPDPVREATREAALLFGDGGRSLAGNPARTARAAALLEYLAANLAPDPRFAAIGTTAGFELRTARTELRAALGTRSGAAPDDVIRALVAAQSAISRNDRGAAAAARGTLGGSGELERLGWYPLSQARTQPLADITGKILTEFADWLLVPEAKRHLREKIVYRGNDNRMSDE